MKKNSVDLNLSIKNDVCLLSGDLTRHTVPCLSVEKIQKFLVADKAVFDFKDVEKVDTAGLAFVCSLLEQANGKQCKLSLINFPEQLTKLAKLSGVEEFLPIT